MSSISKEQIGLLFTIKAYEKVLYECITEDKNLVAQGKEPIHKKDIEELKAELLELSTRLVITVGYGR